MARVRHIIQKEVSQEWWFTAKAKTLCTIFKLYREYNLKIPDLNYQIFYHLSFQTFGHERKLKFLQVLCVCVCSYCYDYIVSVPDTICRISFIHQCI